MLRQSWPGQEFFVKTKCFYVKTECGQIERFCVATEQLCVTTELAKVRGNYVKTEQFYVTIELARVGRNFVAIEGDRAGHDKGALPPTTEPSAHDRHARSTRMCSRQKHECDRGIMWQ